MNNSLLICLLFLLINFNFSITDAQASEIDSLERVLNGYEKEDSLKADLLIQLAQSHEFYTKEALNYATSALELSKKLEYQRGKATSLIQIADYHYYQSDYKTTLQFCKRGLRIAREINNTSQITYCLNIIGLSYDFEGNTVEALRYFQKALKINEKTHDEVGMGVTLKNLGAIYSKLEERDKAIECFQKALKISRKTGNKKHLVVSLISLGDEYEAGNNHNKALYYFEKGLKVAKEESDEDNVVYCLESLAAASRQKREYLKSLQYYQQALDLNQKLKRQNNFSVIYQGVAAVYFDIKNYDEALTYAEKSLEIAKPLKGLKNRKDAHGLLAKIHAIAENYQEAYVHHVKFTTLKDSLFNRESIKAFTNLDNQFRYTKEKEAIALKQQKKDLIQKAKTEEQDTIRKLLTVGIILTILLVLIAVYVFFQKKAANRELAEQKMEISNTNEELNITLETINQQKDTIEKSHRKTRASINYASKIQTALLPSQEAFSTFLPQHFILYKPKDIVSGDFFYIKKINNFIMIAVADCTGHGVPGALVSMLGISFLNEIVIKKEVKTAAEVLEKLRHRVKTSFRQSDPNTQSKDGMDIALCLIDTETNLAHFAGAHNPLYIVRNKELIEIKGSKNPIGIYLKERPFENHQIQLQDSDSIYLFSDGYIDQFGGEKGMKFMSRKFRQLITDTANEPFSKQKEILDVRLENWKNGREQVDDITVLGFKYSSKIIS